MPRKVNRPEGKTPWGRAVEYTSPSGKTTTLFNIGALAAAVGRTAQTLRKWEITGTIPPTPFKMNGCRMYSKEHIDALVSCVEKYHITMGVQISPEFKRAIYQRFRELNDYFFKVESEVTENESEEG